MMEPRNLKVSTVDTVLSSIVRGGRMGEFLLKSTTISTVLNVFNSKLFWWHHETSCSTSRLYAVSSLSRMRPITVISSANFNSLTDGSFEIGIQREEKW